MNGSSLIFVYISGGIILIILIPLLTTGALNTFDDRLNAQKDKMIAKVEGSVKAMKIKIDQFESRWQMNKPSLDEKSELTSAIASEFVSQFGTWEAQVHCPASSPSLSLCVRVCMGLSLVLSL